MSYVIQVTNTILAKLLTFFKNYEPEVTEL